MITDTRDCQGTAAAQSHTTLVLLQLARLMHGACRRVLEHLLSNTLHCAAAGRCMQGVRTAEKINRVSASGASTVLIQSFLTLTAACIIVHVALHRTCIRHYTVYSQ
eukprot:scpid105644/ scgid14288/ 